MLSQIAYSLFPATGQFELLPPNFSTVDAALLSYSSINGVEAVEQFVANIPMAGQALQAMNVAAAAAPDAAAPVESSLAPFLAGASKVGGAVSSPSLGSGAVLANVLRANMIGPLSVPASWTAPSTGTVSPFAPAGLTAFTGPKRQPGPVSLAYPGCRRRR